MSSGLVGPERARRSSGSGGTGSGRASGTETSGGEVRVNTFVGRTAESERGMTDAASPAGASTTPKKLAVRKKSIAELTSKEPLSSPAASEELVRTRKSSSTEETSLERKREKLRSLPDSTGSRTERQERTVEDNGYEEVDEASLRSQFVMAKPAKIKSSSSSIEAKRRLIQEREREEEARAAAAAASEQKREKRQDDDEEDEYADDFENYEEDFEDADGEDEKPVLDLKSKKPSSANAFAPDLRKRSSLSSMSSVVEKQKTSTDLKASTGRFNKVKKTPPARKQQVQALGSDLDSLDAGNVGVQLGHSGGYRAQAVRVAELTELGLLNGLSQCRHDVFEQHSLPPWEYYMRQVAAGGSRRQALTQTNDDARDECIQTEQATLQERWTQQDQAGVGSQAEEKDGFFADDPEADVFPGLAALTELCEVVLEENRVFWARGCEEEKQGDGKRRSPSSMARSVRKLDAPRDQDLGLQDRQVVDICFSPLESHILVSAHSPSERGSAEQGRFSQSSILCVWDLNAPADRSLRHVLVCQGSVTRCMIGPHKSLVVVAGTEEGSLSVWDVPQQGFDSQVSVEHATYCTGPSAAASTGHLGKVVSLALLETQGTRATHASQMFFQFASLDEPGFIHIWAVLSHEQQGSEDARASAANSSQDSGILVGGRVALQHIDRVTVFPGKANKGKKVEEHLAQAPLATSFAFHPKDIGQLFVTSTSGHVHHITRIGAKIAPSLFFPDQGVSRSLLPGSQQATCIEFHPDLSNLFLVGYSSGAIALFSADTSIPVKLWSPGHTARDVMNGSGYACVVRIAWSRTIPTVFFALDTSGAIHSWDLLADPIGPLFRESGVPVPPGAAFALSSVQLLTMAPSLAKVAAGGLLEVLELSAPSSKGPVVIHDETSDAKENSQSNAQLSKAEACLLNLF